MTMQFARLAAPLIAAAFLAGCISQPKPFDRIPFPAAEYAPLPTAGTGVVEGQVFMKTVGGDVKSGAGAEVVLNPITSYSEQWYDAAYVKHAPIQKGDERQEKYLRIVQADGSGNFKFSDVPPGKYFLTSGVFWQAPPQFGLTQQGSQMTNRINVTNGQTIWSIITR